MRTRLLLMVVVAGLAAAGAIVRGQNAAATGVVTGVVTSEKGPEAGVWVIAETDDLKTKFRKIVVTNDQGRFLLPELPRANYRVWVRGYGLIDSKPMMAKEGQRSEAGRHDAKTPQEAAKIYPANHWLSLMEMPKASDFPGTGAKGNGIPSRRRRATSTCTR